MASNLAQCVPVLDAYMRESLHSVAKMSSLQLLASS